MSCVAWLVVGVLCLCFLSPSRVKRESLVCVKKVATFYRRWLSPIQRKIDINIINNIVSFFITHISFIIFLNEVFFTMMFVH